MLNNEQCEVAEKVWGIDDPEPEWIKKEINSWQGFGRTLEAMAGGNIIIESVAKHYTDYLRGAITKEELWERTHLAALEALKNG